MSYQKNYPNGWQSGEAGGTPITPAALDNIEKGIANALPKDGTDPMTADLPMGGHRVTGLGDPVADGDAVPLGYANGHFAPAGYGYGDEISCVLWNDSDGTLFENYIDTNILPRMAGNKTIQITQCVDYPANDVSGNGGMAIVKKSSEGADALITFFGHGGLIAMKQKLANVWYPWEYLNPRMQLGVEYRTTKRHEGKPVYTMAINLGALPNSAGASVPINVANIQYMLSATGRMSNSNTIPYKNLITISADAFEVYITAIADFSYATGVATLEYTKTTD